MRKITPLFFFLLFIVGVISSCKKTTENQLINGLWSLKQVYLDTMTTNYLNTFPEFTNDHNCCFYKMNFNDAGELDGFYVTNDSIKYVAVGHWSLLEYNKVYMSLDQFIDGNFNIKKLTPSNWELTSDTNHIKMFDNGVNPKYDTSYTKLELLSI
jgi:hypothetical protein